MFLKNTRIAALGLGFAAALGIVVACTGQGRAKDKPKYVFKESGPAGAMISIDGKAFDQEQLMGDNKGEYAEALKRIYDLNVAGTGRLLLEVGYAEEAKKAGMSVDEYIETKVLKSDFKVSDSEYNAFVKEKNIPKEQLNPQLKERILTYMKGQKRMEQRDALVVNLSKKHKVEVYYKKPDVRTDIEVGEAPVMGPKDAKVKVVAFSDFQCPFCSRAAGIMTQLKKAYGNKIQMAFKHYPLPMHPQAKPASEASMCINEQSSDKFWKFHDKLFENQDKLDDENLKKYAKAVGANMEKFTECFNSKKYAALVENDLKYGSQKGVSSTPTFYINGIEVKGAQPIERFKEIIDDELAG